MPSICEMVTILRSHRSSTLRPSGVSDMATTCSVVKAGRPRTASVAWSITFSLSSSTPNSVT